MFVTTNLADGWGYEEAGNAVGVFRLLIVWFETCPSELAGRPVVQAAVGPDFVVLLSPIGNLVALLGTSASWVPPAGAWLVRHGGLCRSAPPHPPARLDMVARRGCLEWSAAWLLVLWRHRQLHVCVRAEVPDALAGPDHRVSAVPDRRWPLPSCAVSKTRRLTASGG